MSGSTRNFQSRSVQNSLCALTVASIPGVPSYYTHEGIFCGGGASGRWDISAAVVAAVVTTAPEEPQEAAVR